MCLILHHAEVCCQCAWVCRPTHPHTQVPLDAPERFVIEILFSNGAATDPTLTALPDHTLPTTPRSNLVDGHGVSLARLVELVGGYASDTAGVKLPATGSTGSEAQVGGH